MRLDGRRAAVTGWDSPLGDVLARALERAGAVMAEGSEPLDLLVEATPLARVGALLAPVTPIALAEAMQPLADLGEEASRVEPGGALLVITAQAGPARGWGAPMLALRRAWVAEMAREMAPRGVRVNGIAAVMAGARLPGFLKGAATSSGLATPAEVAEAALWFLSSPSVTGRTLDLGPLP